MRLKRGETPIIFDESHRLELNKAQVLTGNDHSEVCIIAGGMMIPAALAGAQVLESHGVSAVVLNVPVIKPLDAATIVGAARHSRIVITAENHNIIGGLGSAVAEALAEAGSAVPLRRVGIADVFGESGSREFLFQRYGLSTQNILDVAWRGLGLGGPSPVAPVVESVPGAYAPV
jgi:transketolase